MSAALQQRLARQLDAAAPRQLQAPPSVQVEGKLTRMVGLTLEAIGLPAVIGSRCLVRQPGQADVEAEVVGFSGDFMSLMPIDPVHGLGPSARVLPLRHGALAPVGPGLLGRVLDGAGRPLDGKGPIRAERHVPLDRHAAKPARPPADPRAAGCRRAQHQFPAHRRSRPAAGPVRRQRRRQERAAGHDDPLHRRRRDRGRPDRRARAGGERVRHVHPGRRGPASGRWW